MHIAQSGITGLPQRRMPCASGAETTLQCLRTLTTVAFSLWMFGCASKPLLPYSVESPPLVLLPVNDAGVEDKRGRFREIYCAVLEAHGHDLPDYRTCDDALTRVGAEPVGSGRPVDLGSSHRHLIAMVVPGIGYGCIESWLAPAGTVADALRKYGYDLTVIKVDALSSTARNARQIRDAIMARDTAAGQPRVVLVGYSKGAPDEIGRAHV